MLDQIKAMRDRLAKGHALRFRVNTSEMGPALNLGDQVTVRGVPFHSVRQGDLVLCQMGFRVVMRQVLRRVRNDGDYLEVSASSGSGPVLLVAAPNYLGRITRVERPQVREDWWTHLLRRLREGGAFN